MWPDANRRGAEVISKADFFEGGSYAETAKLLRQLAAQLQSNALEALENAVDEVDATWRREYTGGNLALEKRLLTIWTILAAAAKSLSPEEITRQQSVMVELTRNSWVLTPIGEAFMPFPPGRTRFVGMCLEYLMNAEGVFDQAVRYIFGLFSLIGGAPISADDLNEMDLRDIQEKLRLGGVQPEHLFDGWLDGHVRNSIAHCRFWYDGEKRKMVFVDLNPKTKVRWEKSFTIEEFGELYHRLDDTCHLFVCLLFLLRVSQLALTTDVPQLTGAH